MNDSIQQFLFARIEFRLIARRGRGRFLLEKMSMIGSTSVGETRRVRGGKVILDIGVRFKDRTDMQKPTADILAKAEPPCTYRESIDLFFLSERKESFQLTVIGRYSTVE